MDEDSIWSIIIETKDDQDGWKNKRGTGSRPNCGCGSWKDHWKKHSGRNFPKTCSVLRCSGLAEDTAHVFRPEDGRFEWLVPLCKKCNNSRNKDIFSLNIGTALVNANKSETCG